MIDVHIGTKSSMNARSSNQMCCEMRPVISRHQKAIHNKPTRNNAAQSNVNNERDRGRSRRVNKYPATATNGINQTAMGAM